MKEIKVPIFIFDKKSDSVIFFCSLGIFVVSFRLIGAEFADRTTLLEKKDFGKKVFNNKSNYAEYATFFNNIGLTFVCLNDA